MLSNLFKNTMSSINGSNISGSVTAGGSISM